MSTASPVKRAPVREKSLPRRFLHSNLSTRFVEDGGSLRHVVEATVAVPASHLHLPAFPRDEGGILDIDREEVPSFWRLPTARSLNRDGSDFPQGLVLDLDHTPAQLELGVGVIRVRDRRVQEDARVTQEVAGLARARD